MKTTLYTCSITHSLIRYNLKHFAKFYGDVLLMDDSDRKLQFLLDKETKTHYQLQKYGHQQKKRPKMQVTSANIKHVLKFKYMGIVRT